MRFFILLSFFITSTTTFLLPAPTSLTVRSVTVSDVRCSSLLYNKKKSSKSKKATPSKGFGAVLKSLTPTFKYTGTITPHPQSPTCTIPDTVKSNSLPSYHKTSIPHQPNNLPWQIEKKSPQDIQKMIKAGHIARQVLDAAGRAVKPGITTDQIDKIVHEETIKRGAYPSPLNYHGYPKSCCTSINEIICHGIPDSRPLENSDILNIDVTCYFEGFHGDCSEMFFVGEVEEEGRRLVQVTYDCWVMAMEWVKPGRKYQDLGGIIEDYVSKEGYTTVRSFCGHGIGSTFHTTPNILHYKNSEPNGTMEPGHTFTIEPMICEGTNKHVTWPDDWTAATADGKRTAQFEHTLLITEDGCIPLTGKIETSMKQEWEEKSEVHKGFWMGTTQK